MILKLWFDSEHCQQLWYCGSRVKEVDYKLSHCLPSHEHLGVLSSTEAIGRLLSIVTGYCFTSYCNIFYSTNGIFSPS